MSQLVVLGDNEVNEILVGLDKEDTATFRTAIASSLADYSARGERRNQPDPATVTRDDGRKTLFRLFTSNDGPGVKIVVDPTTPAAIKTQDTKNSHEKPMLHGLLAVADRDGRAKGFVNADSITAYRTAMSVMVSFMWRSRVSNIVLFGAGQTALWHVRLVTRLRGDEVRSITIVNRSIQRARDLAQQCQQELEALSITHIAFDVLDQQDTSYDAKLQRTLKNADIVFSTIPSPRPLFPSSYVDRTSESKGSCFISGIGSWQPDMVELDPELLKIASKKGRLMVDDRDEAMRSAGEVIQSQLEASQMIEVGQLVHMREDDPSKFDEEEKECLAEGLVVYKSVGVSITDLASANTLLALAQKLEKGTIVPEF